MFAQADFARSNTAVLRINTELKIPLFRYWHRLPGPGSLHCRFFTDQNILPMKKQLLFVLLSFAGLTASAQWHGTNLSTYSYVTVIMEQHKGKLFSTSGTVYSAALATLNSDNTSWTTIPTGSTIIRPVLLKDADSRLYMTTAEGIVNSLLYYTRDNGATFVVDTAGLPRLGTGVAPIGRIQYHHGKIIAAMAGDGYFIKDTADAAFHSINVPTMFNAPSDPLTCYNGVLYGFDRTGTSAFYTSSDWGANWTLVTTNLPTDYSGTLLTVDEATGRLYMAGAWGATVTYGLKYSDDGGKTWTDATSANAFISKNYSNTQQQITAVYAHDKDVYIALENNKDMTAPDIISSSTGLSGLAYDTTGLPSIGGAGNGINFLSYQGRIALCLNVLDVYLKGTPNAVKKQQVADAGFTLYPNPCTDHIMLSRTGTAAADEFRIIDYTGKTVVTLPAHTREVDLRHLNAGLYLMQAFKDGMITAVQRFVKD